MRAAGLMWTALIILVGVSLFVLKYKVQALEDELHAKQERIERARTAIRVLEAEWAYLNDPERLARLSAEHLGLVPPAPTQVARIDALPLRTPGRAAPAGASDPSAAGVQAQQPVLPVPSDAPRRSAGTEPSNTENATAGAAAMPAALPAHQRPSLVLATVARLQRLIPPGWAGVTIEAETRP